MSAFSNQTIISLLDLTSLHENDTEQSIHALCAHAKQAMGQIAAVCVLPKFIRCAKQFLEDSSIAVATVCNFPRGDAPLELVQQQIHQAVLEGADEIDVVLPYQRYLSGDKNYIFTFLNDCRHSAKDRILKIILETGELITAHNILDAAFIAIECGADFIKTSTGKTATGATPLAVEAILQAIATHPSQEKVGIKISGGIRTREQALHYLQQIEKTMGADWIKPSHVRIGASALLNELI